jgi:inositol-hexakisphosphate kinase
VKGVKFYFFFRKGASSSRMSSREYLVLENLTKDYKKPCVLDLKMGTRMYGDFATDSKRKSQRKKSTKSTSAKLGVRFCGSQRFSFSNNSFEMFDKYVGRNADETELRKLLGQFFTHGCSLRKDVINNVLGEICRMKKSLVDLEEYRFYSSSILIIYEGLMKEEKCESYNLSDAENSMDCDIFEMEAAEANNFDVEKCRKNELPSSAVTMKIIDFANASFPCMDCDQSMHEGPDRGFLMGLDNLYEILESLL